MLASTYVEDEPELTCELGHDVIDFALGLQSGRVVEYIKDVWRRLASAHAGLPTVVAFSDRAREALGA
jgi:hypothetical protein